MRHIPRRVRLRRTLTTAAAAVAVVTGVWVVHDGLTAAGPATPPSIAAGTLPGTGPDGTTTQPGATLPPSTPVRLLAPTLRLDAALVPIGLDAGHHLLPPPLDRPKEAGWWAQGPTPGSPGTAVVVGHVDDRRGPAVFFLLGRLRPGDPLRVTRRDGRTARFTVDAVRLYSKSTFPSQEVYGARPGPPQLRLLTCGGRYDPGTGYAANTVVYAHLTGTGGPEHAAG